MRFRTQNRSPHSRAYGSRRNISGITMIEVLVMAGVMVVITVVFIGGLPTFNENIAVRKEAERLALELRNAQSNAILGRAAPTAGSTPLYWGVRVDLTNPNQYIIFADLNGNRQYNVGIDEILKTVSFENAISITGLSSPSGPENELNFFFSVPYGDTEVYNAAINVGSWGGVTLSSPKRTIIRTVTMRVSGQISITQ